MQIDVNYQFVNLDGKIIREPSKDKETKGPPFTLRKICVTVLLNPGEEKLSADDKIERYEFAKRIHKSNGLVDMGPEEQVLLKRLVGEAYPPLTVAQAYEILDPHEAEKKKKKP